MLAETSQHGYEEAARPWIGVNALAGPTGGPRQDENGSSPPSRPGSKEMLPERVPSSTSYCARVADTEPALPLPRS